MISTFLKKLKIRGLKQREIAEKVGLKQSYVSGLYNGAGCSLETAIRIADAFGVSLDEVISRETPETKLTPFEKMLLDVVAGDDQIAQAAIQCALHERFEKIKEEAGGKEKAA